MSMHTQGRDDEKLIHVRQPSQRRARRRSQGVLGLVLALALLAGLPLAQSASSQTGPAYELDQFIPLGVGSSDMVAVDGDRMVVKASSTAVNVYAHDGSDWLLTDSLVRPLGTPTLATGSNGLRLSGDTIVAGTSTGRGAHVWLHDGTEWGHQFIDLPEDYTGNLTGFGRPSFGRTVATTGDTVLVGGPRDGEDNSQTGSVWIFGFEDGTLVEQDKLQAAVPREPQFFGQAIAVDGDRLLIGAPQSADSGRAHVFERDGDGSWAEAYRLRGSGESNFGFSVALRGGTAAVAEHPNSVPGNPGLSLGERNVHVFDHVDVPGTSGIWAQTVIPEQDPRETFRGFGNSLAIEDDRVLVADSVLRAIPGDDSSPVTGAVYVFDRAADPIAGLVTSGWDLVQTLRGEDQTVTGRFGSSLASDGDWLAVGATTPVAQRGAHIFEQTRSAPPSNVGELDDLGLGLPNVVPNELPQLHDTVLDVRENVLEQFPPVHEIVPGGSPLATDIDWVEVKDESEPPFPYAISTDGDRMVACSGMTGDLFTDFFEPWFVAYERTAGGWERVQQFQMPALSCIGGFGGFGGQVLDGDTVVIPTLDEFTFGAGPLAVYTHDGTQWAHHHDVATTSLPNYGAMDLGGDVIATASSGAGDTQEGAMVLYSRDGLDDEFVEDAVIFGGEASIRLGSDVSVSNGRVLVGVLRDRSDLRRALWEEQVELSDEEQVGPVFQELRDAMVAAVEACREHWSDESNCDTLEGLRAFVSSQFTFPGGAWVYEKVDGTWTQQARLNPDVELQGFNFNLGTGVELVNDTAAFHGSVTLTPFPHAAAFEDLLRNTELLLADLVFNPLELANYAQDPTLFLADVLGLGRDVDPAENMKVGSTWVYRALPAQSQVWALEARLSQPLHGYRGPLAGGVFAFKMIQLGNEGNRIMISGGGDHLLDPNSSANPTAASRTGQFIFDRPAGLGGWIHTFRQWNEVHPAARPMVLDERSSRIDSLFYADRADVPNVELQTAHPSLVPDLFGDGAFVPQPCSVLPPGPPPGAGPGPVPPVCSLPRP